MKRFIPILCPVLLLFAWGCASPGFDLDMNPLFRHLDHQTTASTDCDTLIPFVYAHRNPQSTGWGVRPLFGTDYFPQEDRRTWDFLPPLGRAVSDEHRTTCRFWPLYWYTRSVRSDEKEDVDWILFPLLYGGHSHDGEDYFAFFPLAGRVRSFFGFDTFDFLLWPLYQRVKTVAGEDSVSHSILFFLAWTLGGNRDGSFRFLPFYMHRMWEDRYDRYSVLWPLFHYQRNRLDTDHPSTLYAFWPLFTYEQSAIHSRLGLIGPLFFSGPLIQVAEETPDYWEDQPNVEGRSYYIYDLPWPIFHMEKQREFESFRILPFYSHRREEGFDSKAYLIPFFWHRREWNDAYEREDFYFVPFFHRKHKRYALTGGEENRLQFWPLFHHASTESGTRDFSLLSLLPSGLETYIEPMDEAFWPFWNLYRYRRTPEGATRHDALLGLFHLFDGPGEFRFSFPLLYSYHQTPDLPWRHDFLLGLFSVGGDSEGLKKLNFLFIPFLDS